MKSIEIIERIEGEARLALEFEDSIVNDARIEFLNFRGFEYILKEKPILDSLVYTPRVCGICNQAHLFATVKAIEDIYAQNGVVLELSDKAKTLRELGVSIEIISSHIKWFYYFIMPDVVKFSQGYDEYKAVKGAKWQKAQQITSEFTKALAIFAGQWPHSSYMIPGGVVSDITYSDLSFIENAFDDVLEFFLNDMFALDYDKCSDLKGLSCLNEIGGDVKDFIDISLTSNIYNIGTSYDNFLTLSSSLGFTKGKIRTKKINKIDLELIKESEEFTFKVNKQKSEKEYSWAKSVKYNKEFYETGPLSRAIIANRTFIKSMHRKYKDSIFTRILARVDEIFHLINYSKKLIKEINLNEPSYIKPKENLKNFENTTSYGVVEAARGSLYHKIVTHKGIIKEYDIITPTLWNLSPGDKEKYGVAQNAIIGSKSRVEAELILRSFDVCSVCTTH